MQVTLPERIVASYPAAILGYAHSGWVGEIPSPDALGVRLKLGVAQRLFQTGGLYCATGDFKVDLNINVGRSGVSPGRPCA